MSDTSKQWQTNGICGICTMLGKCNKQCKKNKARISLLAYIHTKEQMRKGEIRCD
jgi:hypothetical protein